MSVTTIGLIEMAIVVAERKEIKRLPGYFHRRLIG